MQDMQPSHGATRPLLTALEVQELLHIDRSTVYRMAEDGRLPAIRVGRSWRFPTAGIDALVGTPAEPEAGNLGPDAHVGAPPSGGPSVEAAPGINHGQPCPPLNTEVARAAVEVAADLLGVMMVVTDMHGRPITPVANKCRWFAEHAADPEVLDRCVIEWRDLADHPDLSPRFQSGALGFQCARAFIRHGSTLVGMVLAGGVSPSTDAAADPDLHHLDDAGRMRVLSALPRIAAAIATPAAPAASPAPAPPTAATPNSAPRIAASPKENS